jgi:branched-chain amino acid transport system substrate-binding protein
MSKEEKKINRRDYLKYTGAAIGGLVVGGALGYVLKPAEVIEKTIPGATVTIPGTTVTKTVEKTVTATLPTTVSITSVVTTKPVLEEVKIGALYPLTGPGGAAGKEYVEGHKFAVEIINNEYDFPFSLAKTKGLPNLGGAKIKLVVADTQGLPEVGRAEAERLITRENVVALIGCYQSGVTDPASAVAENYKIPFLDPDAVAPSLTQRGFKYFFRTTPTEEQVAITYFEFLDEVKAKGYDLKTVLICTDTELWGRQFLEYNKKEAAKHGYTLLPEILYKQGATDLTAEVQKIKSENPDVLIVGPAVEDAILLTRTMKKFDVNIKCILTNEVFTYPAYLEACRNDAEGFIIRGMFSPALAEAKPWLKELTALYKKFSGYSAFSDASSRSFTGMICLADAINRAGSTDPEAIRRALVETDIPGDQIIMPWKGIKFDETGQNIYGRILLFQLQKGNLEIVYPWNLATAKLVFPCPTWAEKSK